MTQTAILILFLLSFPVLVLWAEKKLRIIRLISPIIICYLLLVFALAMGSMANFSRLLSASSALFWFCGFVVFVSILIHYLLAMLFRIDRDILIISSTAAIYGPPFIAPVAQAIENKNLITIGISLGLIGYAMGNFLGLSLAFILK